MRIKQDPITKLWCREDGAVLLPPSGTKFKKFRWTFGFDVGGYRRIQHRGKSYPVHQIICRAFHGLPPEGKPFCDHRDRCRANNVPANLHWVSCKENLANQAKVDTALEKYCVRECENRKAYKKAYNPAYYETHRDECLAREAARYATKAAKMKEQGLTYRKGPDGKQGWFLASGQN